MIRDILNLLMPGWLFGLGIINNTKAADTSGINEEARASAQLGRDAFNWYTKEYADTADDRAADTKRAQDLSDAQLAGMNYAVEQAKDADNYNKTTYRPLEQKIVADAQTYDTPERRHQEATAAVNEVNRQVGAQRVAASQELARAGVAPDSMKSAAIMDAGSVGAAKAAAGADYTARKGVEQQGYARMADAVSLGRNLPSQQATQQQIATTAGSAGVQANQGVQTSRTAGTSLMDKAFGSGGLRAETRADVVNRRQDQQRRQDSGLTPDVERASMRAVTGTQSQPGDILTPSGFPFRNRRSAIAAAARAGTGFAPVEIAPDTFVVRQTPTATDEQDTPAGPGSAAPAEAAEQARTDQGGASAAGSGAGPSAAAGSAAVPADGLSQPAEIRPASGQPFKAKAPAVRAAKQNPGYKVAEVEGGWVLRKETGDAGTDDRGSGAAGPADAGAGDAPGGVVAERDGRAPTPGTGTGAEVGDLPDGAVGADGAALKRVTGEVIDKDWTAFAPESGTKGIPRADMPQIKAEHRGAMVNFLAARGIAHEAGETPAGDLKPTQAEFSPAKVDGAKAYTGGERSILVSSDGHVLDGHHQWLAKLADDAPVKTITLDAPIEKLIAEVNEFPSVQASEGATAPAVAEPVAAAAKEQTRPARPPAPKAAPGAKIDDFGEKLLGARKDYLEFMKRMWTAGEPGSIERTEGRKAALFGLALLVMAAGAQGLPGADDLDDLVDTIGQKMGNDTNSKAWKQKNLPAWLQYGFSALPGIPLDVAGRLGIGNLIPGTGLLRKDKTDKSGDVLEVAGAVGGVAKNAMLAADSGSLAPMMPTAIANAMKAVDIAKTGAYRDTKGRRVIDADLSDAVTKGIGFQPATVAAASRVDGIKISRDTLARNTEASIASDWASARFERDAEGEMAARRRLKEWNDTNPDTPIAISMPQIVKRVQQMQSTRADRIAKLTPKEMRNTAKP